MVTSYGHFSIFGESKGVQGGPKLPAHAGSKLLQVASSGFKWLQVAQRSWPRQGPPGTIRGSPGLQTRGRAKHQFVYENPRRPRARAPLKPPL